MPSARASATGQVPRMSPPPLRAHGRGRKEWGLSLAILMAWTLSKTKRMNGALPPNSNETFFTVPAHCRVRSLPISVDRVGQQRKKALRHQAALSRPPPRGPLEQDRQRPVPVLGLDHHGGDDPVFPRLAHQLLDLALAAVEPASLAVVQLQNKAVEIAEMVIDQRLDLAGIFVQAMRLLRTRERRRQSAVPVGRGLNLRRIAAKLGDADRNQLQVTPEHRPPATGVRDSPRRSTGRSKAAALHGRAAIPSY